MAWFRIMHKRKLVYHILVLVFLYVNILLCFTLIYIALERLQLGFIVDHHASLYHQTNQWGHLLRPLYFSAITLFSVGYGDLTPFGWARFFASLESMIGYIIPASFVIQYMRINLLKKSYKRTQQNDV